MFLFFCFEICCVKPRVFVRNGLFSGAFCLVSGSASLNYRKHLLSILIRGHEVLPISLRGIKVDANVAGKVEVFSLLM